MARFEENDLVVSFPSTYRARKFDDQEHGLSHCMKAVDFIVERENETLYIEFKDPDNPNSNQKSKSKFMYKLVGGAIIEDLKRKYRDTWLYQWAGRKNNKPIIYLVLLAFRNLDAALLINQNDELKRQLPIANTPDSWKRALAKDCQILDLEIWNRNYPEMTIRRISELPTT